MDVTGISGFKAALRTRRRLSGRPVLAATIAALAMLPATAPAALANSAAAEYFRTRADRSAVPKLLSEDERAFYKDMFASIRKADWVHVQALFAQKADGPLHAVACAEYFLAAGSPRVELDQLNQWLAGGTQLPEAEQIGNLALKRGALSLPGLPQPQSLVALRSSPRRNLPRDVADGTMPASVAAAIQERIKADDPSGARVLLDGVDAGLSPEARAQWRQRVAWSFYIGGQDGDAYSLGVSASQGSGAWIAEGWWTAGLAALRAGDCSEAGDAFANAAATAQNPELAAAGHYWRSRALVRCRQPELASAPLKAAAAYDETLYGMLAAEQLGMKLPATHDQPDFTANDWQRLRENGNVRAAVALAEIGEDGLADEILRHQARIGDPAQYQPLSRLARDLGLPAAQLWMATNVPAGASAEPAARYPTPKWTPVTGWQVDPALVYAHTLQESVFRARAVSPAGARGLMQIMPAAARDHAGELGVAGTATDLTNPEVNLAFGQLHLQALRQSPGTQGLLPKVIAAYNAGPLPVLRWNQQIRDQGDPLLWMESVPYWETRGYVATVLRNYWMYERQAGGPSESRIALVQGMWPTFPGLSGGKAIRVAGSTPASGAAPANYAR
jgi:soluble lytic murein transglycosylase-like protein